MPSDLHPVGARAQVIHPFRATINATADIIPYDKDMRTRRTGTEVRGNAISTYTGWFELVS